VILAGKQSIVRIEGEFVASSHRLREYVASELPSGPRRNRRREEEPYVRAVT
jgi:hypothetical protein